VAASLSSAIGQTWPAFALVAGLLLIGSVAAADGVFEVAGARLARVPGDGVVLLCCLLALVAAVTVVLNLDTSVVFLTPILLHAARTRGVDERAFLYGSVLMANSASLLLPGSNLTNLLVLGGQHVGGLTFASRMLPAWVAAILVTAALLIVWRWRDLRVQPTVRSPSGQAPPWRPGLGLAATAAAAMLILVLADPALPVLGLGLVTAGGQIGRGRLSAKAATRAMNIPLLGGVFLLAVGLGTVARLWDAPGRFVHAIGSWQAAGLGAIASVVINNLPAAMLLTPITPAHPRALLLGLNLGPNLALTGSLSAILWTRVAREAGAAPSAVTYTRLGLLLVPSSIAAGLAALAMFTTAGLPL
jgi:arsenical pump membrane protein